MREALGLAPKHSSQPQGNCLDKHELLELVKRWSTVEDLGAGHAEAERVDGLGFSRYISDVATLTRSRSEELYSEVKSNYRICGFLKEI
ncbi:hypothetical protein V6N13_142567 [Hibiscus sabdariffa]